MCTLSTSKSQKLRKSETLKNLEIQRLDEIKSVNGHTVHSRSRTKHQKKIKEHSVTQFVAIRTDKLNPTYLDRYFTAGQSQHRIAIMHGIEGLDTVSLK